jgi:hypothetical protein
MLHIEWNRNKALEPALSSCREVSHVTGRWQGCTCTFALMLQAVYCMHPTYLSVYPSITYLSTYSHQSMSLSVYLYCIACPFTCLPRLSSIVPS